MKGIREMTLILMELISVRLKYKPVPVYLLNLLSVVRGRERERGRGIKGEREREIEGREGGRAKKRRKLE